MFFSCSASPHVTSPCFKLMLRCKKIWILLQIARITVSTAKHKTQGHQLNFLWAKVWHNHEHSVATEQAQHLTFIIWKNQILTFFYLKSDKKFDVPAFYPMEGWGGCGGRGRSFLPGNFHGFSRRSRLRQPRAPNSKFMLRPCPLTKCIFKARA